MPEPFNPPGIRPWHDMPTHKGCDGGIIMGDIDKSLRCTSCGDTPRLTMGERRQGLRSERYWNLALDHTDQEAWWAVEYLRLWADALHMNDTRQAEMFDG